MAKASKEVVLPVVRLAGHSLFKASAFDDSDEPTFNGRVLITKGSKAHEKAKAAIAEVFKREFGEAFTADSKKWPLHDGTKLEEKPGFDETVVYLNFKSDMQPALTTVENPNETLHEAEGIIYPGCYGHLWVRFYAWGPGKYGKGVGCEIRGFKFVKDGERLGGVKPATVDDFPDLDEEVEAGSDWM